MTSRAARRGIPWLVVAGILVTALSLRGPIVAPTPVLREIERDLGITAGAVGLLTTAPVLMFAVLTPLAALFIRRSGPEMALLWSLSGILLGTFVRALPGFGSMLAGMVVIGAAITVGNIVIPVIIRRDVPPAQVATVTAAYVAMLNGGSLLTTLLTAPLADAIGWVAALLAWSAMTLAGIVLWGLHLRRVRGTQERYSGEVAAADAVETLTGPTPVIAGKDERGLLRRPVTWLLVASFGLQASMYYSLTTWLPTLTADQLSLGASASGAIASIFQGAGIVGAFIVPLLARYFPRWVPAAVVGVSWVILAVGMLFAPSLLWLWLAVGAIGHAGGFVVVFSAIVAVARSDGEAAAGSALVQGIGYGLGALAAPVMGWAHDVTGGWTVALGVVVGMSIAYVVLLLASVAATARR